MPLDVFKDHHVAIVTINRPERRNAITFAMRQQFQDIFQELQDDNEIRAIVLTGAGGDFAAGADVGDIGIGGVGGNLGNARTRNRMVRAIAQTQKPVIAAVEGVCIGMAFAMALACDFIIAAENARFQFAFRHIGLAMDAGAGWLLERYVGVMRAKEIAFSGRLISGEEAARLGFVLQAVLPGEAEDKAREMALDLAGAPTLAISEMKRQFYAAPGQSFDQALDYEVAVQALMTWSDDFKEGASAFRARRKPEFRGA